MKPYNLSLFLLFCLSSGQAFAQFSAIEVYGGVGALSVPDELFTSQFTGLQTVGSGENFSLRQQGTSVSVTNTEYKPGQSIQVGLEGHYPVGTKGALYAGIRLQAAFLGYDGGFVSFETTTSGPIDTVFFEPGGVGEGPSFDICPGSSLNFGNNESDRAFIGEIGLPIGYRHRLLKNQISVRIQGSINVPIVNRHFNESVSGELDAASNCFRFIAVDANTSSAYRLNTFVFRVGGGVDFSLGHSFSVGVLVQQQLNSTIESSDTFFAEDGLFISVPEIANLRPLNISLVGRFLIR